MSNTISTLNSLIETLKDGQNGFREAAEASDDTTLKQTLSEYSLQRSRFAGELQAQVIGLGESDPEDSGSIVAAVHRGWIDLKAALTSRDRHAILAECERGEDSAVAAYRKALEADLPADIRQTVAAQQVEVQQAHDRIKALRDAAK